MSLFTHALTSVLLILPCEYHIDCSGWHGKAENEFHVLITAMDGTKFNTRVRLDVGSETATARDLIWSGPEYHGWLGYTVGKAGLVLQGSKKSAIRSVEFTSKDWKPDVRWVPLVPPKK